MVKLSIVILSFNTKRQTLACLQSLISSLQKQLKENRYEIIVLDNASEDGSYEALATFAKPFSFITLIKSDRNLGFGNGNNHAAQASKGEYLWFFNSDAVLAADTVEAPITYLDEHPKVAVLGT